MQYGLINGISLPISRIILGTASFPRDMDSCEWLNAMLALGINTLDTARVYGDSEGTLGRWFEACSTRNRVVLITKGCHPWMGIHRVSGKAIRRDLDASLRALKTDYIDLYLLHRDDPGTTVVEIVDTLGEMQAAGKIRAYGGSNWTHQRIEAANEYAQAHGLPPFAASSPNFSLADPVADLWGGNSLSIAGRGKEEAKAWYQQTGLPVLAYSPLAHGLLSGKMPFADAANVSRYLDKFACRGYASKENFERLRRCEELAAEKHAAVSQVALAWLLHQPMNLFPVVSASSPRRMEINIGSLELELTDEECRYLDLKQEETVLLFR